MMNTRKVDFFPTPYPDELFYSTCSRYSRYSPLRSFIKKQEQLFNSTYVHASVKFAGHLDDFCQNTGNIFEPMEIIQDHTLYPCHSPFLSRERQHKSLRFMCGEARALYVSVGSKLQASGRKRLCYCPDCAREDLEKFGEAYLHRIHHIDGISVCPIHGVRLRDYPIEKNSPLSQCYVYLEAEKLDLSEGEKGDTKLVRLSRIGQELLNFGADQFSIDETTRFLLACFESYGFYRQSKRFVKKVNEWILDTYPEDFLRKNNLLINPNLKNNWLTNFFIRGYLTSPAGGLALVGLVADTFSGFIEKAHSLLDSPLFTDYSYCHNPFCPNYYKLTARLLSIDLHTRRDGPVGIYRCSCGMVYRQHYDCRDYTIVQWGKLYKDKLHELHSNKVTITEISRKAHLTRKSIRNHLNKDSLTQVDDKIHEYKSRIYRFQKKHPEAKAIQYWKYLDSELNYLRKYDPGFWESFSNRLNN